MIYLPSDCPHRHNGRGSRSNGWDISWCHYGTRSLSNDCDGPMDASETASYYYFSECAYWSLEKMRLVVVV